MSFRLNIYGSFVNDFNGKRIMPFPSFQSLQGNYTLVLRIIVILCWFIMFVYSESSYNTAQNNLFYVSVWQKKSTTKMLSSQLQSMHTINNLKWWYEVTELPLCFHIGWLGKFYRTPNYNTNYTVSVKLFTNINFLTYLQSTCIATL